MDPFISWPTPLAQQQLFFLQRENNRQNKNQNRTNQKRSRDYLPFRELRDEQWNCSTENGRDMSLRRTLPCCKQLHNKTSHSMSTNKNNDDNLEFLYMNDTCSQVIFKSVLLSFPPSIPPFPSFSPSLPPFLLSCLLVQTIYQGLYCK